MASGLRTDATPSEAQVRSAQVLTLIVVALAGAGCRSPARVEARAPEPASVQVVGWSLRTQTPVGVRGSVTSDLGREVATFDTARADAAAGVLIENLIPGRYRIEVTARLAHGRAVPARGVESVYLEPGTRLRREVVVDDRDPEVGALPASHRGG